MSAITTADITTETMSYVSAFVFNEEVIDPGILGNMIYGYLGTDIGFLKIMLYYGGGWLILKK